MRAAQLTRDQGTLEGLDLFAQPPLHRRQVGRVAVQRQFQAQGWAEQAGGRWRLTPKGFLVSNQLIGAVLEAQAVEKVQFNPWMQPAFDQTEKQELPPDDNEIFRASLEKI